MAVSPFACADASKTLIDDAIQTVRSSPCCALLVEVGANLAMGSPGDVDFDFAYAANDVNMRPGATSF